MPYRDLETQRAYQRNWMRARREEYFRGKVCAHCGAGGKLELDHIDPAQKIHHVIWSWSAVRRNAELAKCQPLCPPCHAVKSLAQKPLTDGFVPYTHGTLSMYNKHGCRCDECRSARSTYKRELYARRRDLVLAA